MHTSNRYWILLLPLLLGRCSCHATYQHTRVLPAAQWPTALLPAFQFAIQEAAQPYDVYLLMDITPDYPFQNLHVTYYLKNYADEVLQEALKTYSLFDATTGKPLGNGWGSTKRHVVKLLGNYQFAQPGTYTLQLAQFMRTDTLAGIAAVGIKITRANPGP